MYILAFLTSLVAISSQTEHPFSSHLLSSLSLLPPQKGLPFLVVVGDSSDEGVRLLHSAMKHVTNTSDLRPPERHPCVQLLTMSGSMGEVHVLMSRGESEDTHFCEPHVYGPIPDVMQVVFPSKTKYDFARYEDYVTLMMTSKGGRIRFDVELTGSNAATNLLVAIQSLLVISRDALAYVNGVPSFHRSEHMKANKKQIANITDVRYAEKLKDSIPMDILMAVLISPLTLMALAISIFVITTKARVHHTGGYSSASTMDYSIAGDPSLALSVESGEAAGGGTSLETAEETGSRSMRSARDVTVKSNTKKSAILGSLFSGSGKHEVKLESARTAPVVAAEVTHEVASEERVMRTQTSSPLLTHAKIISTNSSSAESEDQHLLTARPKASNSINPSKTQEMTLDS